MDEKTLNQLMWELTRQLTLSRLDTDEKFQAAKAELTRDDIKMTTDLLFADLQGLTVAQIPVSAKTMNFYLAGVFRSMEKSVTKDKLVDGGVVVDQTLRPALKLFLQNQSALHAAFDYAINSEGKFAELYYATYIADVWPGAILPTNLNGVDLYVFEYKTIGGKIVYLDNYDKPISDADFRTCVENLIHNRHPNTKIKRDREIKVRKIVEIKSRKTNGTWSKSFDQSFEFGVKQLMDIAEGKFDEKHSLALVLFDEHDITRFALLLEDTESAASYKKLQNLILCESALNEFKWKSHAKKISDAIFDISSKSFIQSMLTSNRNSYRAPLWKIAPQSKWFFKNFDDKWSDSWKLISSAEVHKLIESDFNMPKGVFQQRVLNAIWQELSLRWQDLSDVLVKSIVTSKGKYMNFGKLEDENKRIRIVDKFNDLGARWLAAVAEGYDGYLAKDRIVNSINNIQSTLKITPNRKYSSQSFDQENEKLNIESKSKDLAVMEWKTDNDGIDLMQSDKLNISIYEFKLTNENELPKDKKLKKDGDMYKVVDKRRPKRKLC